MDSKESLRAVLVLLGIDFAALLRPGELSCELLAKEVRP
jgi:hypothetical protein